MSVQSNKQAVNNQVHEVEEEEETGYQKIALLQVRNVLFDCCLYFNSSMF